MGDWPLTGSYGRAENAGSLTASSQGTSLTTGAANTKGSYAQLIASTSFPSSWMEVRIEDEATTASTDYLVDIAIGAASSEVVIASNLVHTTWSGFNVSTYMLPIAVPSGVRLSVRGQAISSSRVIRVAAVLYGGSFVGQSPCNLIETFGAATADSGGVSVDPGGSANTKGAWSQLTAASTYSTRYLVLGLGNQANSARTNSRMLIDIGIGAAGSEVVVIPDLIVNGDSASQCPMPKTHLAPVAIPAGARIAARSQCSITDATDRLIDVVAYGLS